MSKILDVFEKLIPPAQSVSEPLEPDYTFAAAPKPPRPPKKRKRPTREIIRNPTRP